MDGSIVAPAPASLAVLPTGTPAHTDFCNRRSAMLAGLKNFIAEGGSVSDVQMEIDGTTNAMNSLLALHDAGRE